MKAARLQGRLQAGAVLGPWGSLREGQGRGVAADKTSVGSEGLTMYLLWRIIVLVRPAPKAGIGFATGSGGRARGAPWSFGVRGPQPNDKVGTNAARTRPSQKATNVSGRLAVGPELPLSLSAPLYPTLYPILLAACPFYPAPNFGIPSEACQAMSLNVDLPPPMKTHGDRPRASREKRAKKFERDRLCQLHRRLTA